MSIIAMAMERWIETNIQPLSLNVQTLGYFYVHNGLCARVTILGVSVSNSSFVPVTFGRL